ncbi:MAG: SpoIID/LytB domain-containing protein [Candidatus Sumerlaeia bacterium]|nr:SpoIID/LytB domain-containing protein [Candidatus Sumerlaeia bacterium]
MRIAPFSILLLCLSLAGCLSKRTVEVPEEPMIRVLIIETLETAKFTTSGGWTAISASGGRTALSGENSYAWRADGDTVVLEVNGRQVYRTVRLNLEPTSASSLLNIEGVPYGVGWWWESLQDRSYPGKFHVRVNQEGLLDVIVTLPVEEYLLGVVPQEIGPDSPMEALKAQAVAARTETIVALRTRKYAGPGYDICADVACQAYSGTARYSDATAEAVAATRGIVLVHNGEPFSAYYASNCGGHSENIENVWPERSGPRPYWTGIPDSDETIDVNLSDSRELRSWLDANPDVCCNPEIYPELPEWTKQNFRWVREFTAEELTAEVARKRDIGRVLAIEPVSRGVSGRMIQARFVGENGSFTVGPELAIRQVWSPPLRSAAFVVDTEGPADRPERFIIRGAGWGHGVGMCQTGAIGRALRGQDYTTILAHYYQESGLATEY